MKQKRSPIAAQVLPLAGRRLPANWADGMNAGGNYDKRILEDLWKDAQWGAKQQDSPTKNARLSSPTWAELFGQQ